MSRRSSRLSGSAPRWMPPATDRKKPGSCESAKPGRCRKSGGRRPQFSPFFSVLLAEGVQRDDLAALALFLRSFRLGCLPGDVGLDLLDRLAPIQGAMRLELQGKI